MDAALHAARVRRNRSQIRQKPARTGIATGGNDPAPDWSGADLARFPLWLDGRRAILRPSPCPRVW